MSETVMRCGTVIKVRKGRASVRLDMAETRPECAACGGGCASASGVSGQVVHVHSLPGLKPGDRARVQMRAAPATWAAAVLFLIPLLLLGAGAGLWAWLASLSLLPESQGLALLAGVGLMGAWWIAVALVERRRMRNPEYGPHIVETLPEHGGTK